LETLILQFITATQNIAKAQGVSETSELKTSGPYTAYTQSIFLQLIDINQLTSMIDMKSMRQHAQVLFT